MADGPSLNEEIGLEQVLEAHRMKAREMTEPQLVSALADLRRNNTNPGIIKIYEDEAKSRLIRDYLKLGAFGAGLYFLYKFFVR